MRGVNPEVEEVNEARDCKKGELFINKTGPEWCLDLEKTAFVILFFNFNLTL